MKNIGAAGLQGEGPQGRPPQAAVAGRPQAAPQPRLRRGALRAAVRGLHGVSEEQSRRACAAGGPAQPPDEVRLPAANPRGARPQGALCAAPFPPAQSQKRESSSSADFWLVRVYRGMRMRQAGSRVSRQGLPSTPRDAAKPSCSKSCWLWRLYEPKG